MYSAVLQAMPNEVLDRMFDFYMNVPILDPRDRDLDGISLWAFCCPAMRKIAMEKLHVARVRFACRQVRKYTKVDCSEPRSRANLSGMLSLVEWKALVYTIWEKFDERSPELEHRMIDLRPDTSFALQNKVQHFLIVQLKRANLIEVTRANHSPCPASDDADALEHYPTLEVHHLTLQDALLDPSCCGDFVSHFAPTEEMIQKSLELLPRGLIDHCVRILAYMAGVTKMTDACFDYIWGLLVNVTFKILDHAMTRLESYPPESDPAKKRILSPDESPMDFPPFARIWRYDIIADCPVPGMIEEAVNALHMVRSDVPQHQPSHWDSWESWHFQTPFDETHHLGDQFREHPFRLSHHGWEYLENGVKDDAAIIDTDRIDSPKELYSFANEYVFCDTEEEYERLMADPENDDEDLTDPMELDNLFSDSDLDSESAQENS